MALLHGTPPDVRQVQPRQHPDVSDGYGQGGAKEGLPRAARGRATPKPQTLNPKP
jgi:hypothetical protein